MTNRNIQLVIILLVAAILRIAAISLRPPEAMLQAPDEPDFYNLALSVAHGEGFAMDGQPTAYRDMLFPSLVGVAFRLTGGWLPIFILLQIAADLLTIFLLYRIGAGRFGERIGIFMAAAWAIYPAAIFYCSLFLTETLFVFLVTLALYLYDKVEASWNKQTVSPLGPPAKWGGGPSAHIPAALLGLTLGLATLTRSAGLVFLATFLIYIVLFRFETPRGIRFRTAGFVVLGAAIVCLPWMLRNHRVLGSFSLNTNTGVNLYIGNNPYATGAYRFDDPVEAPLLAADPQQPGGEVARNELAMSLALEYWRTHTGVIPDLWARKFAYLWATDMPLWLHYDPAAPAIGGEGLSLRERLHTLPFSKLALSALPHMLIVCFGAAGIFLTRHFSTRGLFILQLTLGAVATFVSFGLFRFHFPLIPALMVSAASLIRPSPWDSAPQWRRLYLLLFLGIFAGIWTYEILSIARV